MMKLKLTMLALALSLTAACLKKNSKSPAPAPPVKAMAPKPAPEPKVAPTPEPAPAPEAAAPEKKKKKKGMPLGLPTTALLKDQIGMDGKQLREIKKMYAGYKDQMVAAGQKVRTAADADKKQARKDAAPLRKEILDKVVAIMTEEQKTKYQEFLAKRKEAAKKRQEANPKK